MTNSVDPTITDLLHAGAAGDPSAEEHLWALIYDELRGMARRYVSAERKNHTLQATALVHEAYLRLVDQRSSSWQSRNHFLAIAAKMMRRVLIDHARARSRSKRGGGATMLEIDMIADVPAGTNAEIVAVDEALKALERIDPFKASVVELRFFGGLTHSEVGQVLGCSEATVRRHWPVAKAWLRRELKDLANGC
jgi:RNA polymerase sigma factor (TIGR02999 family)